MLRRLTMLCVLTSAMTAVTTKVTSKAQGNEKRLNAIVAKLPAIPKTSPGSSSGGTAYSGNTSYDINASTDNAPSGGSGGGADNPGGGVSNTSGPTAGTAHTHSMQHGHYYGSLATDFNALRDSYSTTVTDLHTNKNVLDDLVTRFNNLVAALSAAGIIQ